MLLLLLLLLLHIIVVFYRALDSLDNHTIIPRLKMFKYPITILIIIIIIIQSPNSCIMRSASGRPDDCVALWRARLNKRHRSSHAENPDRNDDSGVSETEPTAGGCPRGYRRENYSTFKVNACFEPSQKSRNPR